MTDYEVYGVIRELKPPKRVIPYYSYPINRKDYKVELEKAIKEVNYAKKKTNGKELL